MNFEDWQSYRPTSTLAVSIIVLGIFKVAREDIHGF